MPKFCKNSENNEDRQLWGCWGVDSCEWDLSGPKFKVLPSAVGGGVIKPILEGVKFLFHIQNAGILTLKNINSYK